MTDYDIDFVLWTQEQAASLRAGDFSILDLAHLAEEIDSMGKRDRRAVASLMRNVIMHWLKWHHQPDQQSNSWRASIKQGRDKIRRILKDSPSLRRELPHLLEEEYPDARLDAAEETGLPLNTFPERSPFTIEQILEDIPLKTNCV